jgi:hypothetical protein
MLLYQSSWSHQELDQRHRQLVADQQSSLSQHGLDHRHRHVGRKSTIRCAQHTNCDRSSRRGRDGWRGRSCGCHGRGQHARCVGRCGTSSRNHWCGNKTRVKCATADAEKGSYTAKDGSRCCSPCSNRTSVFCQDSLTIDCGVIRHRIMSLPF